MKALIIFFIKGLVPIITALIGYAGIKAGFRKYKANKGNDPDEPTLVSKEVCDLKHSGTEEAMAAIAGSVKDLQSDVKEVIRNQTALTSIEGPLDKLRQDLREDIENAVENAVDSHEKVFHKYSKVINE